MIAVAFALPQESRPFVAALRCATARLGPFECPVVRGTLRGREIGVFHTGLGDACARERLARLAQTCAAADFERLIAAGFAGGLDPALPAGSLVLSGENGAECARARAILEGRARVGCIATSPEVLETPQAKARFARETGALAVEMENAALGDFAREQGIPFLTLRAITDPAGEVLPVPTPVWFDTAAQRPRPGALLSFLLAHPSRWGAFARFLWNVHRARTALTAALIDLVERI